MLKVVLGLLLTLTLVYADPCADGTYPEGHLFGIEGQCSSVYYLCVHGSSTQSSCGQSTVWNDEKGYCDHAYNVDACSVANIVDCKDATGTPASTGGYTKPGDCKGGTYYVCVNGVEQTESCADGLVFDPETQVCDWGYNQEDCDKTTTSTSTTTISTTTTTDPGDLTGGNTTDGITDGPFDTTTTTITTTTKNTDDSAGGNTTDGITDGPFDTTTTTIKTTTENTDGSGGDSDSGDTGVTTQNPFINTTTTTQEPKGDTFVGFVVDDTGSMANEIKAVKEWIISCVHGTSSSCGDPPTGGWVITSFNDPGVGRVIGPTRDINEIIKEADGYYAHGGGDCPELAFTGLENAVKVIPAVNSFCKVFFFTDATAKDASRADAVSKLYQDKGCSFIPILTSCCGSCPPVCDTVNPDYYLTHVTDKTSIDSSCSTRISRSVKASVQTQFYTLAEETGGSIYVTDKPSSSDDMLDFLEEEVTLGFCGSDIVAGPSPDGYKCEKDCTAMKMCWDKSVSKCYCNDTTVCTHDAIPSGYSQCDGEQIVVCHPNVVLEIIPEQRNCTGYFQCNYGALYHFNCAPGTIFSAASSSYCDHPENVPPPCGTKTDDDIM